MALLESWLFSNESCNNFKRKKKHKFPIDDVEKFKIQTKKIYNGGHFFSISRSISVWFGLIIDFNMQIILNAKENSRITIEMLWFFYVVYIIIMC